MDTETIIAKAIKEAERLNIVVTICIVDAAGHMLALRRMEACSYFSIEASRLKAVTASQLKAPTHLLADIAQKIPALQQAFDKNPEVLTLPGGLPVKDNGSIMGGIGVSGGDFGQDRAIAEAALAT